MDVIHITMLNNMVIATRTQDGMVTQLAEAIRSELSAQLSEVNQYGDVRKTIRFRTVITDLHK